MIKFTRVPPPKSRFSNSSETCRYIYSPVLKLPDSTVSIPVFTFSHSNNHFKIFRKIKILEPLFPRLSKYFRLLQCIASFGQVYRAHWQEVSATRLLTNVSGDFELASTVIPLPGLLRDAADADTGEGQQEVILGDAVRVTVSVVHGDICGASRM
jgi:hypothetical protein